ncbi:23S rRNA (uracil(1939)-C(5))-methyltransferase RlmD [Candidatus Saccharibacteria bacterium]|jgi:23S rRNA (uracil1939-C5)-methyltransferase|nr:23S rRNA (uracil(1939)-C(5))-methyltransferase RlmD [Candidatus Saccharibacteria bacterium]
MKKTREEIVEVSKLVHGGQGLGLLPDGKKVFAWGALPGEKVLVRLTKSKRDWAEGYVVEVIEPSKDRIDPEEPSIYLATSPWQILNYKIEASFKQHILNEAFEREGVEVNWQLFYQPKEPFNYRNKMEYNFWFFTDTNQVSLALHRRGSHQKVAVEGSLLASNEINNAGKALIKYINDNAIEARPLKSVILRSDLSGRVGISLFVNDKNIKDSFNSFSHDNSIFEIVYSNPKSPASVTTEVLLPNNEPLIDVLLGRKFDYSTRSFFQVNIPVYEKVLEIIKNEIKDDKKDILDMYSGVGSIGLSVVGKNQKLTMVEVSEESTDQAKKNMAGLENCEVVTATSESALNYITSDSTIILDPPRAGLHKVVVEKLTEEKPTKIIYLSCNPSTQARDVKMLLEAGYKISYAQGFNFFPRTPHIENLFVLEI